MTDEREPNGRSYSQPASLHAKPNGRPLSGSAHVVLDDRICVTLRLSELIQLRAEA